MNFAFNFQFEFARSAGSKVFGGGFIVSVLESDVTIQSTLEIDMNSRFSSLQFHFQQNHAGNRAILSNTGYSSDFNWIFPIDTTSIGRLECGVRLSCLGSLIVFLIPLAQSTNDARSVSELEVVRQLDMIRDRILAKADNQLHNHLLQLDIPLPLFGM